MARLWSSGFELNSLGVGVEITATGGTGGTIQTSTVRSGTYALQITSLVSATSKHIRYRYSLNDDNGPFYFRAYLRVATRPSATNAVIRVFDSGNTTGLVFISIKSDGSLELSDEDGVIGSASSVLSLDTWYMVEIKVDRTGAAGSHVVEARLNGTVFATSSARSLSLGFGSICFGGNQKLEAQTQGDWFWDDIGINNSTGSFQNSYPGAGGILHLRPSATGDNGDWSGGFGSVDEVTPDDATTHLASVTAGDIEDLNIDNTPADIGASDTINLVQVGARWRNDDNTDDGTKFVVRVKAASGGTVEESANLTCLNTTFVTNSHTTPINYPLTLYDLPGASTTAWTKADLDTAQIGVRLTVGGTGDFAHVTTLWLLVEYNAAITDVNVTVSDSISVTESVKPTLINLVSKSDSITVSESVDPELVNLVRVSDLISLTENKATSEVPNPGVSEAVTVSESVAMYLESYVAVSDSITVSENIVLNLESYVNVSDSITVSEAVSVLLVHLVNVSNSIAVAEELKLEVNSYVNVNDLVIISESIETSGVPNPNISESIAVAEAIALNPTSYPMVMDSPSVAEDVQVALDPNIVSVSDAIAVSETISNQLTSYIRVSDSIAVSEATSQVLAHLVTVSDSVTVSESVTLDLINNITVSEAISVSESAQTTVVSLVEKSDAIGVSESLSVVVPINLAVSDSIAVAESLQQVLVSSISKSDSITVSEPYTTVTTAYLAPTVTVSSSGVLLPDNIFTSNDLYAVYDAVADTAQWGTFGNYGLTSLAVIEGIEAQLEGKLIGVSPGDNAVTYEIWNASSGTWSSAKTATFNSTSDTTVTLGGATDLWGKSWIASDFDSGTLKIRITGSSFGVANTINLDFTQLGVYSHRFVEVTQDGNVNVSESIAVTEAVSLLIPVLHTTLSEAVAITESVNTQLSSFVAVADNVGLSESLALNLIGFLAVSESISVSEAISLLLAGFIAVSDSISLSEAISLSTGGGIAVSDTVTVTESVGAYLTTLNIEVSESVTISEALLLSAGGGVAIMDSPSVAEVVTVLIPTLIVNVSDSVTVSEGVSMGVQTGRLSRMGLLGVG